MPKATLSAADLFVQVDREFRRRRPRECVTCQVSLPIRLPAQDGAAGWQMLTTGGDCPTTCDAILEEIVKEYRGRYELAT